jgi:hypothetical protein
MYRPIRASSPFVHLSVADQVYSCAGERILSIIPAGPPPAISMSPLLDICAAYAEAVIGPNRPLRRSFP